MRLLSTLKSHLSTLASLLSFVAGLVWFVFTAGCLLATPTWFVWWVVTGMGDPGSVPEFWDMARGWMFVLVGFFAGRWAAGREE